MLSRVVYNSDFKEKNLFSPVVVHTLKKSVVHNKKLYSDVLKTSQRKPWKRVHTDCVCLHRQIHHVPNVEKRKSVAFEKKGANAFQCKSDCRAITVKGRRRMTNRTVTEKASEILLTNRFAPLAAKQYSDKNCIYPLK